MPDDFPSNVKTVLGQRAGWRCSNPRCRISTSGPGDDPDKGVNRGKAAHITAERPRGPRYDPALSHAERAGTGNGIWLCGNCHDLVDKDHPGYPVRLLQAWKREAEEHAKRELADPGLSRHTDRGAVTSYLRALIEELNRDSWPARNGLDGPPLTPAAIERRLRVQPRDRGGQREEANADELAASCRRLVILGGPGSGKTWLARRIARRSAEQALAELAAGAGLDEVELPLCTTASMLSQAAGVIRNAVIASTLDQLPDMGGGDVTETIRSHFANRQSAVLLVIDSIDEAQHPDRRLLQADNLTGWRIVVTSRPSSWTGQLDIRDGEPGHQVGDLRPLEYPEDVEAFIGKWFATEPAKAAALAAEIAGRRSFQQAATVPLILAFYCILGGSAPLPQTRHALYDQVVRHLVAGFWRDAGRPPAIGPCLDLLQRWAWDAAAKDPVSGTGTWADEFPTRTGDEDPAVRDAAAHIALPVGPADLHDVTTRRFIHRSVREYLVARYLAGRPAEQVAGELLNHVWYDPDWEYAGPAALALHPERDEILRRLVGQVTRTESAPDDLSPVDPDFQLCQFLSEAAIESSEEDWAPDSAATVSRARLRLADRDHPRLAPARGWPAHEARRKAGLLARLTGAGAVHGTLDVLLPLQPDDTELGQARAAVLALMAQADAEEDACLLAHDLARTNPGPADRAQARNLLWERLRDADRPSDRCRVESAIAALGPGDDERWQLFSWLARPGAIDSREEYRAVWVASRLIADPGTRRWTLETWRFLRWDDFRELLASAPEVFRDGSPPALRLVAEHVGRACDDDPDGLDAFGYSPWRFWRFHGWTAEELRAYQEGVLVVLETLTDAEKARTLVWRLDVADFPGPGQRARAQQAIRRLLAAEKSVEGAAWLVDALDMLDPECPERNGDTRLVDFVRYLVGDMADEGRADLVPDVPAGLRGDGDVHAELHGLLTRMLAAAGPETLPFVHAYLPLVEPLVLTELIRFLERLAALPETPAASANDVNDAARCRRTLVSLLARQPGRDERVSLARALLRLDPLPGERAEAVRLLADLAGDSDEARAWDVVELISALLATSQAGELADVLQPALRFLAQAREPAIASHLILLLAEQEQEMTVGERQMAADALCPLLADDSRRWTIDALAEALRVFAQDPGVMQAARERLLRKIRSRTSASHAIDLAKRLAPLFPGADGLQAARQELLDWLEATSDEHDAHRLIEALEHMGTQPGDMAALRTHLLKLTQASYASMASKQAATRSPVHVATALVRADRSPRELLRPGAPGVWTYLLPSLRRHLAVEDWIGVIPPAPTPPRAGTRAPLSPTGNHAM
jgi:hypothetical protein